MTRGTTISIYIPDSNPKGVKICEISNSIVKALFIPRNKLEEVYGREDLQKPGLYFLFGIDEESSKVVTYIGEAEPLLKRLKEHNKKKDFWISAVCFVSEKNNLNKAHIKYLESYSYSLAKKVNKTILENSVVPPQSSLTEQDEDFVMSFFDDLKVILSTLGFQIFAESKRERKNLFICKGRDAYAEGEYTENGMTIYKGAKIQKDHKESLSKQIMIKKEWMWRHGELKDKGDFYELTEDYTLSSPSAASSMVLGRSSNGWTDWKTEDGETLDERYRK